MLLSYISMSYKNKTDDSWVYRTIRKYKWNRQTDIQQTSCHSNQSRQIEIHVYQNMLFFPPKRVLECTSVQENCSYIKTFLNHAPSWLAVK